MRHINLIIWNIYAWQCLSSTSRGSALFEEDAEDADELKIRHWTDRDCFEFAGPLEIHWEQNLRTALLMETPPGNIVRALVDMVAIQRRVMAFPSEGDFGKVRRSIAFSVEDFVSRVSDNFKSSYKKLVAKLSKAGCAPNPIQLDPHSVLRYKSIAERINERTPLRRELCITSENVRRNVDDRHSKVHEFIASLNLVKHSLMVLHGRIPF